MNHRCKFFRRHSLAVILVGVVPNVDRTKATTEWLDVIVDAIKASTPGRMTTEEAMAKPTQ